MSVKGDHRTGTDIDFEPPGQGDVFEVLSNERRRYVLRALRGREDEPVELGTLARQVAAWENDVDPGEVTYDQRKRVYTALQQTHLPMMDEAGALDFNKHRGRIESVERTGDFDYYLTVVPRGTLLFSHYYTALGVVSTLLATLVAFGVIPFPVLSPMVLPALVIAIFTSIAAVHVVHRRRTRWGASEVVTE